MKTFFKKYFRNLKGRFGNDPVLDRPSDLTCCSQKDFNGELACFDTAENHLRAFKICTPDAHSNVSQMCFDAFGCNFDTQPAPNNKHHLNGIRIVRKFFAAHRNGETIEACPEEHGRSFTGMFSDLSRKGLRRLRNCLRLRHLSVAFCSVSGGSEKSSPTERKMLKSEEGCLGIIHRLFTRVFSRFSPACFQSSIYRFGMQHARIANRSCFGRHPFFVSSLVVASLGMCFSGNVRADTASGMQQLALVANQHFGAKQFEQAVEDYRQALALGKSPQLYYNLGQAYANLNKPGFALACFLQAETLKPRWELNKRALTQLYEENPTLLKPPFPWYHTLFRMFSKNVWCWCCAAFFWLFVGLILCYAVAHRNKAILIHAVVSGVCFGATGLFLLLNRPYESLCLLPEQTVGHYAPGDNSPMRYDWPAGTCCNIRSEVSDFYFVTTLNQEDGWVKKDALLSLK